MFGGPVCPGDTETAAPRLAPVISIRADCELCSRSKVRPSPFEAAQMTQLSDRRLSGKRHAARDWALQVNEPCSGA